MKVNLKIDSRDLLALRRQAAGWQKRVQSSQGTLVHFLVEEFGRQYCEAIVSGMGVVPHTGGTTVLAPVQGLQASATYHALSDRTVEKKDDRKWNLNIWMASGETARAVRTHKAKVAARRVTVFSGILGGGKDQEALEKAIQSEFGFEHPDIEEHWEGRPLFTVLNDLLLQHRETIYENIRRAVIQDALAAGWGRT